MYLRFELFFVFAHKLHIVRHRFSSIYMTIRRKRKKIYYWRAYVQHSFVISRRKSTFFHSLLLFCQTIYLRFFFQCAYYIRIRSQWKYYENCIFFHTSMHTYVYFYAFYLTEFVCICLIFIFHADGFVAAAAAATTIVDVIVSNLLEIF